MADSDGNRPRWQIARLVLRAVAWGVLAFTLGHLRIQLPGTRTMQTDLREVALISSAFSLPSAWLTLIAAFLGSFGSDSFLIDLRTTLPMHLAAVPFAFYAQRWLRRRELGYFALGLAWAACVGVYYLVLIVPVMAAANVVFMGRTVAEAPGMYLHMLRALPYEILFTAGITSLALVAREELPRRTRAEARLREALATQRALLESAPMAVVGVRASGLVSSWNRAAEKLFGRPASEAIGGPAPRVGRRSGAAGDAALITLALAGTPMLADEGEVVSSTGGRIPVAFSSAPLRDAAGTSLGAVLLVEDVREQLALRAQVQRSATLSALGQLVGGLAHELRNPLFGISATLDAFGPHLTGHPKLQAMDRTLRTQVQHIHALMLDLLDYGKASATERTPASLELPLHHALHDCAAQAAAAAVTLDLAFPAGLPQVAMDSAQLLQVFRNLIQNAVSFSPRDGVVRIAVSVELVDEQRFVSIEVLDRGTGFRPEDLDSVFEPFFTRRSGGTGLGLSIVQRIVEHHGGTVTASNRSDGGARVVVLLPAVIRV